MFYHFLWLPDHMLFSPHKTMPHNLRSLMLYAILRNPSATVLSLLPAWNAPGSGAEPLLYVYKE